MEHVISRVAEAMQYDFMQKALLVGCLIAVCCSLLGIFLVLRKYSMIGDGLAHVGFASVAVALLLGTSPLFISIPIVTLSSVFILRLNERADMHGDAAIGLVSSFSVAVGVLISSVSKGFNVDLFSYLFGSILVISDTDVIFSIVLSIVVIATILIFYHSLFSITYDEEFARVIGLRTVRINYLIAVLTSITIVLGIRVVGTMLISSMIVFPTISALQISRSFKGTMIISALISLICVIVGVFSSFIMNFPTGASIVILNAVVFTVFYIAKRVIRA